MNQLTLTRIAFHIFLLLLTISTLNAAEKTVLDRLTLTNISFNTDEKGNLNPYIFIPMYYGSQSQFYSALAYSSKSVSDVSGVANFKDSKNAFISSSKKLTLNYITYKCRLYNYEVSFGLESSYTKVKNNEFGYIQDSNNFFSKGNEYYISFDNAVELDILSHSFRADIVVPSGKYFTSRLFVRLSPFTKISVKQSTIFKPLLKNRGVSKSSTMQDLAYALRYDGLLKTSYIFDIGFVAYYEKQALKYNIAQISQSAGTYIFNDTQVNTDEITTRYLVKILLKKNFLGGLRPSFGYGRENVERLNNLTNNVNSTKRNIFTFALEKLF